MQQKVYTVIHGQEERQIFRNVKRSIDAGADGTFLINHAGIDARSMLLVLEDIKKREKGFFVGVNLLSHTPMDAFVAADLFGADALWLDESYVRETHWSLQEAGYESDMDEQLKKMFVYRSLFKGQYFGSVAFKTHGPCENPAREAKKAIGHMDVVVTSGVDTGHAPEVDKIASMKAAIGDVPLAIASGISPENVHLFPMADIFMVATGISDSWTELSEAKIADLVSRKRKI